MEAAAHPPWWAESGGLHSAPSPVALQKRVSFYRHFNASLTLVTQCARDPWPRFQGPSGFELTSRAVSLTGRRVGWAALCGPAGGAVCRPELGWPRAASPARRRWGQGRRADRRAPGGGNQALLACRPICSRARLLCPALAGQSRCCNNTPSISGAPRTPGKSAPLSRDVQHRVLLVGQVPHGDLGARLLTCWLRGPPFHLIAGLHLLFLPWARFWWSGEWAFPKNNVFKYISESTQDNKVCNVKM